MSWFITGMVVGGSIAFVAFALVGRR